MVHRNTAQRQCPSLRCAPSKRLAARIYARSQSGHLLKDQDSHQGTISKASLRKDVIIGVKKKKTLNKMNPTLEVGLTTEEGMKTALGVGAITNIIAEEVATPGAVVVIAETVLTEAKGRVKTRSVITEVVTGISTVDAVVTITDDKHLSLPRFKLALMFIVQRSYGVRVTSLCLLL